MIKTTAQQALSIYAEAMRKECWAKAYEKAVSDAFSHGAGWLMVDQSGNIKHVSPGDIRGWWLDHVKVPDIPHEILDLQDHMKREVYRVTGVDEASLGENKPPKGGKRGDRGIGQG
ncbi:hypothetical protein [Sulfitobacter sp. 915]|uniref:hypothetical protein n=1 Tax=Sulfitobacter sp. 915 TaxID=3368558 RepID=UPI0037470218